MAIYCNLLKHNTQYGIDPYCFTPRPKKLYVHSNMCGWVDAVAKLLLIEALLIWTRPNSHTIIQSRTEKVMSYAHSSSTSSHYYPRAGLW